MLEKISRHYLMHIKEQLFMNFGFKYHSASCYHIFFVRPVFFCTCVKRGRIHKCWKDRFLHFFATGLKKAEKWQLFCIICRHFEPGHDLHFSLKFRCGSRKLWMYFQNVFPQKMLFLCRYVDSLAFQNPCRK